MNNLISFEFKKASKRNKNRVVVLLLIVFSCILLFTNYWLADNIEDNKVNELTYKSESLQDALNGLPSDENNSALQKIRANYKEELELVQKQIAASKTGDWKAELEIQNKIDKNFLKSLQAGEVVGGEPLSVVENRINFHSELLNRNIKPVNESFSAEGLYFLENLNTVLMGLIGVLIFIFIVGDILSNEIERGSIKFLFIQPVSKQKIINAKFITAIISVILLVGTINLITFIISSSLWGGGSSHYPVMILGKSTTFIDLSAYLILCSILFICVIIFIISMQFFFSILTFGNILSTGLTIILTTISYLGINQYGYLASVSHLIPFSYIDVFNVVDGSLGFNLNNTNITIKTGIFILLTGSILLHIVSNIILRKKDIY